MITKQKKTFRDDALQFLSFLINTLDRIDGKEETAPLMKIKENAKMLIEQKDRISLLYNIESFVSVVAKVEVFTEGGSLNGFVKKSDQTRILQLCREFQVRLRLNHEKQRVKFSGEKKRTKKKLIRT